MSLDLARGRELLPCPFCGREAHMVHLTELPDDDPNFGGAFIECTNGICAATTNIHFGEYDAILREKWNRRSAAEHTARLEEALRLADTVATNIEGATEAFERDIRLAIGSTNYNVIMHWLAEYRAAQRALAGETK